MKNEPYKTEHWFSERRQAYIEDTVSARLFEKGLLDEKKEKAEELKKQACQDIYNIIEDRYKSGKLEGKQDLDAYLEGLVEKRLSKFVQQTLDKEIFKTARWKLLKVGLVGGQYLDEVSQYVHIRVLKFYMGKKFDDMYKGEDNRRGYLHGVIINNVNNFIDAVMKEKLKNNKAISLDDDTLSLDDDTLSNIGISLRASDDTLPEKKVISEQISTILRENIIPECLAAAGNPDSIEQMKHIYTAVIERGLTQKEVAKELETGENTVSGMLSKFQRCVVRKSIKKGLREASARIPSSHKATVELLAEIGSNSVYSDKMEKMQFFDAMSYALFCHFNRLGLAHVTDRFYLWKSEKRLKAWMQFIDDINFLSEKKPHLVRDDCLDRYMAYLFDHKKGDIESFESYQDEKSL